MDLAEGTTKDGWWETHSDVVPDWFGLYVGLEASANEIHIYDPELVFGAFQIPDYVRAITREVNPGAGTEGVDAQIKLREERKHALFNRPKPARLTVVYGAGVLARMVGGKRVMADQRNELAELNRRDNVEIRVLPWDAGAHAAMHIGSFTILDFVDSDDPPVVYIETHTGARYLERTEELTDYRRIYQSVYQKSTPLEEYKP